MEWSWMYDLGATHTRQFPNILFYPKSPVNMLAVTVYTRLTGDTKGTYVLTHTSLSLLGFFESTLHSHNSLPDIAVNNGYKYFTTFMDFFQDFPHHLYLWLLAQIYFNAYQKAW